MLLFGSFVTRESVTQSFTVLISCPAGNTLVFLRPWINSLGRCCYSRAVQVSQLHSDNSSLGGTGRISANPPFSTSLLQLTKPAYSVGNPKPTLCEPLACIWWLLCPGLHLLSQCHLAFVSLINHPGSYLLKIPPCSTSWSGPISWWQKLSVIWYPDQLGCMSRTNIVPYCSNYILLTISDTPISIHNMSLLPLIHLIIGYL